MKFPTPRLSWLWERDESGEWTLDRKMAAYYPEFGRPWQRWTRYEKLRFVGSSLMVGLGAGELFWVASQNPAVAVPATASLLIGLTWLWWPRG